ncbi:LysR family transcriptional regulator [Solimonas marina]|uniref:LysR family transcriptional regulator n=1 Tax=Solimonas marina TaxID=2714601 RepID=A0A970B4N9_9GAMM|nr:LysR family transcriptional regulator [Solimonas marina]NKF20750.1 LysR family transcriptional regulator [Solimonas marina]
MELRHLKYFQAVASTLNFSRAAEQLHIAQPPLSRQIQQLEDELGVKLLERGTRPMKLTKAGQFFYDQTVQVLSRLREIEKATKRIAGGNTEWMGVGFVPSTLYGPLPNVLRAFAAENERRDVTLLELTSIQQAQALKSGRIDVGFGRLAIHSEGLENVVLMQEPMVVALPSHSPLVHEARISLERIAGETLLLYPATPRPSYADEVLRQFTTRGYELARTFEVNGLQTAIGLVAAGMGVTIVPSSVQRLHRDDIAYRPLAEEELSSTLIMTVRAGDSSPLLQRFRQMIDAELAIWSTGG